jgi:hypothetical protein
MTPNLTFTLEHEEDNKINFLDLTVTRQVDGITFGIHRKPTTTDTIIPRDSCHPGQHKMAAPRYFRNMINSYDIETAERTKEVSAVTQLLQNNGYNVSTVERILNKEKHIAQENDHGKPKYTWAKFTYQGKETRMITNVFKGSRIRIAFTTKNKLSKLLNYRNSQAQTDQFSKNGIYQLE